MLLLLALSIPADSLEEALDTIAALPFAIDPQIRTHGKQCTIEFPIADTSHAGLVENALRARGLRQTHVEVLEAAAA
jgi:hypothetical protein